MLGTFPKGVAMSDVAIAQRLLHEAWPTRHGRPAKTCMSTILDALKRHERHLQRIDPRSFEYRRPWTARRVRSIWEGDARRIDSYEMGDLELVAVEAAHAERQEAIARAGRLERFISSVGAASAEFKESVARTERMARFVSGFGEDESGARVSPGRRMAGLLDGARA